MSGMNVQKERRAQKPAQIKTEDFRTYLVVRHGAALGLLAHLGFIPMFALLHLPFLAFFNVFSVMIWAYAIWANERGNHATAIHLVAFEVLTHALAATWVLGWQSGFAHYLPTLIVFVMFNHRVRNAFVVTQALVIVASYAALYGFAEPLDPTPRLLSALPVLNVVNVVVSFSTLALISFYFREASLFNERHLEALANTDLLTQLPNRRALWRQLSLEAERAKRQSANLVIAIADVDHFKSINDQHGHDVGDQVLLQLSNELRRCLRENDTVGRWGGEEFLFVLPDLPISEAQTTAERIRQHVENFLIRTSDADLTCTISIGIAVRAANEDIEQTIQRADHALYLAKDGGRNRVSLIK